MERLNKPDYKELKYRQMQRVRTTLNEHLSDAIKDQNDQAAEAFEVSIMLVNREIRKVNQ